MVFRGQTLGKYRIVEPLGSGGFGTVYLAEDTWIDKRVAIKVPLAQTLGNLAVEMQAQMDSTNTLRTIVAGAAGIVPGARWAGRHAHDQGTGQYGAL